MPLLSRRLFMGSSRHLFFPMCPHPQPSLINPRRRLHLTRHRLLFPNPLTGFLRPPATAHVFRSVKPFMLYRQVHLAQVEDEVVQDPLTLLRLKLEEEGIPSAGMKLDKFRTICPQCEGGNSKEKCLSVLIRESGAMWSCSRAKCGWKGHINMHGEGKNCRFNNPVATVKKYQILSEQALGPRPLCNEIHGEGKNYRSNNPVSKVKKYRILSEQALGLRPLRNKLLTYFSERMISGETLRRNAVLQHVKQNVIAFTYRRDGKLINCKYRNITKRMWQEKDTEKIFYGVDDIKDASDIIIVEGEIDKLSMEEAGFRNCVSVPCGAPSAVSKKALPSEEEDTGYQYLWSSKKYLEKASRIILATDADTPGQVLAEELARRLGRERCWRVTWPKKNENDVCKDANEVLMCFGPEALKNVIENAELYPIHGLFQIELRVGLVGEEAEVSKSGKRR